MIRAPLFGLLAALPLAVTMAQADPVTLLTAQGEVSVPAAPAKVAVFDIAAIDTLTALGVTPDGTPDKLYVDYLSDVPVNPVGTLFEPDLEALAQLAPDLIIVGGRSSTQVDALSPIAPTIDMTIWEDIPAEARQRIEAYGTLFGRTEQAADLLATYDAILTAAKAAVAGKGTALILQTNGSKVSAYGKGSRFGWIHTALDLPEAYANLNPDTHGDAVSFEFIAQANPDWLIVVDRAAAIGETASAQATLDNPLVAGTTAGQKGQIIYMSSGPIYIAGGGYTSITTTLSELTAAFSK
ncbi:siderophore ABC transporter substrate-binding protein [Pseudotabrizicola alkalilacus]|uniref:Siderophore ABC transporter substrate-binding protein n=1 Tax=Pseudotabrizicola alkalilacus TaxID=2305252 RepID=A0A411Z0N0_9RHOB|nr:siderophore ABC transporter substrate-binding protein [Pseudotabrizicola alkalilacus]RGP36604.1 siderophore ABC transporter substrate-binding protein [Pseudotabrizicola alkalilacus]